MDGTGEYVSVCPLKDSLICRFSVKRLKGAFNVVFVHRKGWLGCFQPSLIVWPQNIAKMHKCETLFCSVLYAISHEYLEIDIQRLRLSGAINNVMFQSGSRFHLLPRTSTSMTLLFSFSIHKFNWQLINNSLFYWKLKFARIKLKLVLLWSNNEIQTSAKLNGLGRSSALSRLVGHRAWSP